MAARVYSIFIFYLVACCFLFSNCTKTDDTPIPVPDIEVPQPVKPEWRVKRTLTQSWNLKLEYGFDTADLEYDQRGRVTDLKYRLRAGSFPWSTTYTVDRHYRYEYLDTTERVKRYRALNSSGFYSAFNQDFNYDASGMKLQSIIKDFSSQEAWLYHIDSYSIFLPEKYTACYRNWQGTLEDTSEFKNEYYNGLLVKKTQDEKKYDLSRFVTYYEYNEAGNIKYTYKTYNGWFAPNRTDTTRKIWFTWKPSPSPNTKKLKRLPQPNSELSNNGGGGLFYFDSYALLNEVDIFNLVANGQVLVKSKVGRLDHTNVNPGELDYEYVLDANNNIGKIIGTAPGSKAKFETTIEYEKIP